MKKIVIAVGTLLVLVVLVFFVSNFMKVEIIDDAHLVFEMLHKDYPESIEIYDSVWGSSNVTLSESYIGLVELLSKIQVNENYDIREDSDIREITGRLEYENGRDVKFALGKYLVIDNEVFGNDLDLYDISKLRKDLQEELYQIDNLENIIRFSSHINISFLENNYTLSEESRIMLSERFKSLKKIESNKELLEDNDNKGEIKSKILIRSSDDYNYPNIYILVYENNIAHVYDSGVSTGSIMYLNGNLSDIIEKIISNYQ